MTVVEALRQEKAERQIEWLFEFDVLDTSTVVKRKGPGEKLAQLISEL